MFSRFTQLAAVENDHVVRDAARGWILDERFQELIQIEDGDRLFLEPGEYHSEDFILRNIERDGVGNAFDVLRLGPETIEYSSDAGHKF